MALANGIFNEGSYQVIIAVIALSLLLSPLGLEVLRLIAGGSSNREISTAIHKSEGTVKNQVSSKLGVRDRTQAVLKAINLGFL